MHLTAPKFLIFLLTAYFLFLGLLYTDDLIDLHSLWTTHSAYTHGYPVLAISIFILWTKTKRVDFTQSRLLILIPLAICACIYFLTKFIDIQVIRLLAIVTYLPLLLCATYGYRYVKVVLIPYLLLLTTTPSLDMAMTPVLQALATSVNGYLLQALHYPAYVSENTIQIPAGLIVITEGCAGIKFFINAVVFSLLLVIFMPSRSRLIQLFLMVLLVCTSVIANWLRIFILVLVGYYTELQHPLMNDHVTFSWILYALSIIPVFILAAKYQSHAKAVFRHANAYDQSFTNINLSQIIAGIAGLTIIVIPGILYQYNVAQNVAQEDSVKNHHHQLPEELENYTLQQNYPGALRPHFKGADEEITSTYKNASDLIHIAVFTYFRQKQGKELINYDNHFLDPGIWSLQMNEYRKIAGTAGDIHSKKMIAKMRNGQRSVIYAFYLVNNWFLSANWQAKLSQLAATANDHDESALVMFSQYCKTDCATESRSLEDFIAKYTTTILILSGLLE